MQFHSIKSKLLLGAFFLTLNVAFLSGISIYHFQKISRINELEELIYQLQVNALRLIKNDNNFISYDAINPQFYISGNSDILIKRKQYDTHIDSLQKQISRKSKSLSFDLQKELFSVDSLLKVYNYKFDKLKKLLHNRGFKDFGLTGQMRHYAHTLENSHLIETTTLLMLRRHEKDFQLRNDLMYCELFNSLMKSTQVRYLKIITKKP